MNKEQTRETLDKLRKDISQWTVLIVDDEPDNLKVAKTILAYQGASVHIAENGIKGLEALETLEPSFILLDISMPEMNGWDMIKALRENPKHAAMPVIALTAHAMAGDREKVLAAGFDGYISKPFRLTSFLQQITDCLQEIQDKLSADLGEDESSTSKSTETSTTVKPITQIKQETSSPANIDNAVLIEKEQPNGRE